MDYPYGPKPKKKTNPLLKTAEIVAQIAVADGYSTGSRLEDDGPPSPQQVARAWHRKWGEFAAEHGFPYRAELPAAEVAAGGGLGDFFAQMQRLCLPLNEIGGLFQGCWQEVPFTSYMAFDRGEGGSVWPFRFVCAELSGPRPDLVYDQALQGKRPYHLAWYPRLGEYQVVEGPLPPKEPRKEGGWLGRTSVGRDIVKAVDSMLTPDPPMLHSAAPGRDEWLFDWAEAKGAFNFDWAVRDRWLVVFAMEPQYRPREGWQLDMFETLAKVKHLVDPQGAPDPRAQ